jgi:hypothetical protein
MNIQYLIQVLQNKITALGNARSQAFSIGDLEQLALIEKELLDTQSTFSQLAMLTAVTEQAAATNTSAAELFATGLEAKQTAPVQGPSTESIINGYDISAYATDPLHEQKIKNIIAAMPAFTTSADIDAYIQAVAPGSPVTGTMVQTAASLYGIDLPLSLAIMRNDSTFGLYGVGARTNNPGNVGNNGVEERSYASWADGVMAVAEWLSRHRYIIQEPVILPAVVEPVVEVAPPEKPARKRRVVQEEAPEEPEEEPPVVEEPPAPETPPEETPPPPAPIEEPPPVDTGSTTPPVSEPEATTTPSEITP